MAVINATPDSFSDAGQYSTVEARMERTKEVLDKGADILDIGGQSAITGVPEISEDEEIERITPVIQWVAANTNAIMSIDTYRPKVAETTKANRQCKAFKMRCPTCARPSSRSSCVAPKWTATFVRAFVPGQPLA
jgi:dihydropteroate synthase